MAAGVVETTAPGAGKRDENASVRPWLVYAGLLLIQLVNAAYTILTKVATSGKDGANPIVFSLIRDGLAFPLLEGAALVLEGVQVPALSDVPRIALLGVTGMFGNQVAYILGLSMTNSSIATSVNLFQPIAASLMATFIGLERFIWLNLLGVALCVLGALLMVGIGNLKAGGSMLWGVLVLFAGTLCMSIYYILQKPLLKRYPSVSLTAWSYLFGALSIAVACLFYVPWSGEWREQHVKHVWTIANKTWTALAFAIIFNSAIKYAVSTAVNRYTTVSVLTAWGTLVPILTIIGDCTILHKRFYMRYLWLLAILAGLALVTYCKQRFSTVPTGLWAWQKRLLWVCCKIDADARDPADESGAGAAPGEEHRPAADEESPLLPPNADSFYGVPGTRPDGPDRPINDSV